MEKELQDKDNKYLDLYEENNLLHEDMLELQEELEEAFGDSLSDFGFDDDGGKSGGIKIPGAKSGKKALGKLMKTIKKIPKTTKDKVLNKKEKKKSEET